MAGYWQSPEETAPAMTQDGFFRTGDIGVMDEKGHVKIVDRKKDMTWSRGSTSIQTRLRTCSRYPGVLECAVIGVPDAGPARR